MDYEPLGRALAPLDIATYAPELRGQGNDPLPARRGDLDSIETWFADLRAFFSKVRGQHPGLPIFYYGESMGGAILTRFLAQADTEDQPTGLILASPVVAFDQRPPLWINAIFQTLLVIRPKYRIDLRKFAKRDEIPKIVTRDESHREWFKTAPHKLDVFTVRFFKRLQDLIAGCQSAAKNIRVPVLVIYARNDVFIREGLVEAFFTQLASGDKEITLYEESYHLLLHDHDRARVLARVQDWLSQHLTRRPVIAASRG